MCTPPGRRPGRLESRSVGLLRSWPIGPPAGPRPASGHGPSCSCSPPPRRCGGGSDAAPEASLTPMSTRDVPDQVGDLPRIGRPANSALLAAGVTTLAEVAKLGRRNLLAMHGVGPKAVRILGESLAQQGIDLAE